MTSQYPDWVQQARETVTRFEEERQARARRSRAQSDEETREAAQKIIDGIRSTIEQAACQGKRSACVMTVNFDPDTDLPDLPDAVCDLVDKHCKDELGLKIWWNHAPKSHYPGQDLRWGHRDLYVTL